MSDPAEWFESIGYRLEVSADESGIFWADLRSIENPAFLVTRYGRGDSRREAMERARRRWLEEQGNPDRAR